MAVEEKLRKEITMLGQVFGEVILQHAGQPAFELVEKVRAEARDFRDGDASQGDALAALLAGLDAEQLRIVIQAFSGFLELANLAEDRQRVRALRERELKIHPEPRRESAFAAVQELAARGLTAEQTAQALAKIDIELVFTAHPTEAKRKSLRSKLRKMRGMLAELDNSDLLPVEKEQVLLALRSEIVKLWQTDLVRPTKPTVMEEVQRGLSFQGVLWDTVPRVMDQVRRALRQSYPDADVEPPRMIRFGSWMGGDRDGNPFVTPELTEQTCLWLRRAAIEDHLQACETLLDSISISCGATPACDALRDSVAAACERWPEVAEGLERIAADELYRRQLKVVAWRLSQTAQMTLSGPIPDGAYRTVGELRDEVLLAKRSLLATDNEEIVHTDLQPWLDQIDAFGFQTARLDIRQHSGVYAQVMEEIWKSAKLISDDDLPLSEERRVELLLQTLPVAPNLSPVNRSETTRETLDLFRLLRRIARRFGMGALGGHVISMTTSPSDLLTVLWLWRWSERADARNREYDAQIDVNLRLPVVPLFETIDDLQNGAQILTDALAIPEYREHVRGLGEEQMVMVGYSDSTKDGGYLAAQWALHRGQLNIFEAAKQQGVHVTFFHGRGGSLGRGGGPAARAILSLPSETFDGSVRLTEQGEVLAERYDDPHIAHRHLEQMLWSVLTAATHNTSAEMGDWRDLMDRLAASSLRAYRSLVDHDGFVAFFRSATPIAGIERLPIGSRPSRRKGGDRIEDLRAIPWVFSWTQCRCLLPAWYGLGAAFSELTSAEPDSLETLRTLYEDWRFFRATIDNSVLALSKANPPVFKRYAALADHPSAKAIYTLIEEEYNRTRDAVLAVTGCDALLDDVPWLQESIHLRNRYVDPLNFVQVDVMRRAKQAEEGATHADELDRLTQLVIKGVAAGMRTTG
ncbi:Phosphoenolpyruvate carboxylase [Posidoniimonas corsicana]|uniref:Phosphoenolpyruvate carboxylase n=1 Tax=Posidoniimonas corsicana TaxID=1938618 RepID=A0A5C5VH23_9BACT|nr:phosphoenolpyruvate carboxylase [Posidoniimonas corsicana]TWT36962.1 Phosphoenolpyruvate carboxylase [Posidoniimonas corsicana]